MEREGDLKDTQRNTQNAALNVDIFENIFYSDLIPFSQIYNY